MYVRACTIPAFQAGKEELPNANFQLGIWSVNLVVTKGKIFISLTAICNNGLKLKQDQTAKSKVWSMLLKSKLISWVSYITTKLRTDYYNNQSSVHIYVAKLETKTNLHLDTTAEIVPEQIFFWNQNWQKLYLLWKILMRYLVWQEYQHLERQVFCRSRPFQLVFCPYSVLGLLPNSFSISVCVLPPQFVNGLSIIWEVIVTVTLLVNQCIYKYLF